MGLVGGVMCLLPRDISIPEVRLIVGIVCFHFGRLFCCVLAFVQIWFLDNRRLLREPCLIVLENFLKTRMNTIFCVTAVELLGCGPRSVCHPAPHVRPLRLSSFLTDAGAKVK